MNYTGAAIQVRRSNDNALQDIGFTAAGDLDESALLAFVGSNSGFVVKWYDQSGNARDAVQATTANQPRIVNAGVVEKQNSKPTVIFDGTDDYFSADTVASSFTGSSKPLSFFGVVLKTNTNTVSNSVAFGNTETLAQMIQLGRLVGTAKFGWIIRNDANVLVNTESTINYSSNILYSLSVISNGSLVNYFANNNNVINNATHQSGALTLNTFSIGALRRTTIGDFLNGRMSEIILYPSDQFTNRTAIETNINSYYNIY
jgi:hypothetical protein